MKKKETTAWLTKEVLLFELIADSLKSFVKEFKGQRGQKGQKSWEYVIQQNLLREKYWLNSVKKVKSLEQSGARETTIQYKWQIPKTK